jgi:Ni,Fe-hydrogenase maturation factor
VTGSGQAPDIAARDRAGFVAGPVLVIGYGNPLRSDDGVGPAVVARLAGDPRLAGVDLRALHQLTPELASDASGVSLLVLVDAGVAEAPGEVSVRRIEPPASVVRATGGTEAATAEADPEGGGADTAADDPGAWTHHVGPAGILGLSQALYGAAPRLVLVSIGPQSLELGEGLTDCVAAAVTRAADLVATIVIEHRRA